MLKMKTLKYNLKFALKSSKKYFIISTKMLVRNILI